jgi:DNA-binding GntR family transcriptional regulator
MMSDTVSGTRKDAVLRQLRDEIVSRQLTPGTVLKDAEVAARLGVSITPVREAIGRLAAEGLIDTTPNRTRHVAHVTRQNVLDLMDVVQLLACAGFAWGVNHLGEAHIAALRLKCEDLDDNLRLGNLMAAATAAFSFTEIVISASDNRELHTHLDLVVTRVLRVLRLAPPGPIWRVWQDGLRQTLAHLEAGDPSAAISRYRRTHAEYRDSLLDASFD